MNGKGGGRGPPNEETVHDLSSRSGITITKAVRGGQQKCGYWGGGCLELSRYALTEIQIILKTALKCQKGGEGGCKCGCLQMTGDAPPTKGRVWV